MMKILVAYASKHGSTREVAEAVAGTLRETGASVEVEPASEVADVAAYDAVVLGAALYMGRVHKDARAFLKGHALALEHRPFAVFAMGPLKMESKDVAGSRHQLDHALAKYPDLHPFAVEIFGGVIHQDEQHFPFNHMPEGDARDWDAIRRFAGTVATASRAPV
jgi:menaquinone-dependent protoporphyrinogen oxidase